jgi:hypothetical protein
MATFKSKTHRGHIVELTLDEDTTIATRGLATTTWLRYDPPVLRSGQYCSTINRIRYSK